MFADHKSYNRSTVEFFGQPLGLYGPPLGLGGKILAHSNQNSGGLVVADLRGELVVVASSNLVIPRSQRCPIHGGSENWHLVLCKQHARSVVGGPHARSVVEPDGPPLGLVMR